MDPDERKTFIFSLFDLPDVHTQLHECGVQLALGSNQRCYICQNFTVDSKELRDCKIDCCNCFTFQTKGQLITHYVSKLIEVMESSNPGELMFITSIGITKPDYSFLLPLRFKISPQKSTVNS